MLAQASCKRHRSIASDESSLVEAVLFEAGHHEPTLEKCYSRAVPLLGPPPNNDCIDNKTLDRQRRARSLLAHNLGEGMEHINVTRDGNTYHTLLVKPSAQTWSIGKAGKQQCTVARHTRTLVEATATQTQLRVPPRRNER